MIRAPGFSRWMRRMDSHASASAAAVTVQVLSTTRAAPVSDSTGVWPDASRLSRIAPASACVARQPKFWMKKVTIGHMAILTCSQRKAYRVEDENRAMQIPGYAGKLGMTGLRVLVLAQWIRIVIEVGGEPALDFAEFHAFAAVIVLGLIAADFADGEVARLWMRKIDAANRSGRIHSEIFSEANADVFFGVEQIEELALFGVVGRGWITRRRTNAAIFFANQIVAREIFVAAEAPGVARAFVREFRESFGETVGESFGHERAVVVVSFFKVGNERFDLETGSHGECAEIICSASFFWRDEISESVIGFALRLGDLLPERVENGAEAGARFIGINFDVFENAIGRKEAKSSARDEEFFACDARKQLLCIIEKLFGFRANVWFIENARIDAAQFPGVKKRSPVNVRNDFRERNGAGAHAEKGRFRRDVGFPVKSGLTGASLGERKERLRLRATMFFARALLLSAIVVNEAGTQIVAEQAANDADGARGILHMNDGLTVHGRNFHGGVNAAGGCAADEQRNVESFALHFFGDVGHFLERRRD